MYVDFTNKDLTTGSSLGDYFWERICEEVEVLKAEWVKLSLLGTAQSLRPPSRKDT